MVDQQDNTKLKTFHDGLMKANYDVPDYASFEQTLQDPSKAKIFYDGLVKANYELPDYDTFVSDLGLKKKGSPSDYGLPSKEVFSEMFTNISKEKPEVSQRPLDEYNEEKFKTPDLSIKSPEFKGPELESLSGTVSAYLTGERITDKEYRAEAEKRISELDQKIASLPKDETEYLPAMNFSGGLILPTRPVSEEKSRLMKEKDDLRMAIETPSKLTYILGKGYNQSIIGLADNILNGVPRANQDWLSKYDAGTLTDATATALGFMLDAPFFGVMGKVGGAIGKAAAKPIVNRAMNNSVKKFVAAGIEEGLAKKLALKSAAKISQSIAGMSSSGVSLGSYGVVGSALGDWAQPDANFDDIKWGNAFKRGAKDFLLGTSVRGLGIGSSVIASKAGAIPSMAGRMGAKTGVALGGLTAESALFTYGGALLEGRGLKDVSGQEFIDTLALLGIMKASHKAGKIQEAVIDPKKAANNIYKSLQYNPQKPGQGQFEVDIQPWEIDAMKFADARDYKEAMNVLAKDDVKLAEIMKDETIPALLKQKILWGARGVAINDVNIYGEKVVPNEDYVEIYNKEGVLVDKTKYTSKQEAEQASIEIGLQLQDNMMQMRSALPEVDKVKIIADMKAKGTDVNKLLIALDKPVKDRTLEESKMVGDYASMIPKEKAKKEEAVSEEKAPEEAKTEPSTPEDIAKELGLTSAGKQDYGTGQVFDAYDVTTPNGARTQMVVPEGSTREVVSAKRDEMLAAWKKPEVPVEAPEVKTARLNDRLADLRDEYNGIPKSYVKKRAAVMRQIQGILPESGHQMKTEGTNVVIINAKGKPIKRTATKGEYQKLEAIEDVEQKKFVTTLLNAKEHLYGLDIPVYGKQLDKAIDDLLAGKTNQNTQRVVDALSDMYRRGAMKFRGEAQPEVDITIKEVTDQVNDAKFSEFIKENGRFDLETLDKAVEAGLIDKSELQDYKNYFENERKNRLKSEQEWADEEANAQAVDGGSGNKLPESKETRGEDKVTPQELVVDGKTFASKEELFAHLNKIAIDEKGDINVDWFNRETASWPGIEEVRAISEWTAKKKVEIKARKVEASLSPEEAMNESQRLNEAWSSELKKNGVSEKSEALRQKLHDFNKANFEVKINHEQGVDYMSKKPYEYGQIDFSKISGWADQSVFFDVNKAGKYTPNELGKKIGIRYSSGGGSAFLEFKYTPENAKLVSEALKEKGYKTNKLIDEKPNEPSPGTGKTEGDNLSGSTKADVKPVEKQGKTEPITSDPVKQKQIDTINKDYDAKVVDMQKELDSMTEEARQKVIDKASKEIDSRNTLFGDANAVKDGVLKPGDQGFEVSKKPIDEALRKFDERKVELTKDIANLRKEQKSKIDEVLKQQTLGFEEPAKTEVPKTLFHSSKTGIEAIPDGAVVNELGIHLGSKETADKLSKAKGGETREYEIDLKNPIKVDDFARWEAFTVSRRLLKDDVISQQEYDAVNKKTGNDKEKELIKILKDKGYDGFVYDNYFEGGGKSYVVFDKSQIKEISTKTTTNTLNDAVSKYGWSAVRNPEGFWLLNPKGATTVKVKIKKGTYQFFDMAENKLMDGRGQLEKSAEKLLKDYYYAKETKAEVKKADYIKSSISDAELRPILEKNVDYFKMIQKGMIGVKSVDFGKENGVTYMDTFDANGSKGVRYYVHPDFQLSIKNPKAITTGKWLTEGDTHTNTETKYSIEKLDDGRFQVLDPEGFDITGESFKSIKDAKEFADAESKVETPVKETPQSELYNQAEKIIAETNSSKLIPELYDLINKSTDYEGLKSLLEVPYVKTHAEAIKEVNSRLRTLERHPELTEVKVEPTSQGIKFKDKTYTEIEQVQDDFAEGKLTMDEQRDLLEKVRKFEDDLKSEAKKISDDIGNKMDKGASDIEKKIKDDINDKNSKLNIKIIPPDVISMGNTALWKQLVKGRDAIANAIANQLGKGVKSQSDGIRWTSKVLTNLYQGLLRTQADMFGTGQPGSVGKLEMMGTTKSYAPHKASDLLKEWRGVVNSDPEALSRVWAVLDPELATKAGEKQLQYGDLSQAEKNLYFTLKEWNTWVWSTNYANGLIPTESHLKFKGDFDATGYSDYIARMYDAYEEGTILSPEIQEFISRGNSAVTSRLNTDYMKMREETNEWKQEHAIKDPAYLTAKRVMQTIQNVAIKQYMDMIVAEHPEFVVKLKKGEEVPKGFTKLGSSYSWGPLRNRAVANHIVEDFTGFYYQNAIGNTAYDAIKMWDRTKINQFYKKFRTVYNPFVQTGNITGNVFFASINGINPFAFVKGMVDNRNLHQTNPAQYDLLLKSGLIGDTGFTGEMKPMDILNPKQGVLGKADELAMKTYAGADNLAKISAYQIFRKQGLSHQQAVRRAYDSFQNYATVGKTWDISSKIPLIGPTFVKFQADLQRILVNNMMTAPLTTIGTLLMVKMLGNLSSALSGETEEEQALRESRKGVAKIPFVDIPLSFKVGKSEVNVARYLSPLYLYNRGDSEMDMSELSKFMPIQFQKKDEEALFPVPAFADATWGWVGSVLADRDFRMMSIQDPYSTRYTNPNITTDERIANVLNYIARSQIPFYKGAQDIYKGATGQLDYYGRKRTWEQAILNNIIKIQEFDKPELKNYVERNLSYLTSRYASLATRMGDANGNFFKNIKYAEDKGLAPEVISKLYESESKIRDKRLQKSLDEQIPVMQEIERLTNTYKKWYPQDQFIQDNFQNIESGKNQRFNVLDDVDMQKKYKDEYMLLKSNRLLKKPEVPAYLNGKALTDEQRKEYTSTYWSEYIRQLDAMIGLTQEEFDEQTKYIVGREESTTTPMPKETSLLEAQATSAATVARSIAESNLRSNFK